MQVHWYEKYFDHYSKIATTTEMPHGVKMFKIYISCLGFLTNATNPENQVFKRTSALLMPLVGYSPPLYLGSESVRKRIANAGPNVTFFGNRFSFAISMFVC